MIEDIVSCPYDQRINIIVNNVIDHGWKNDKAKDLNTRKT